MSEHNAILTVDTWPEPGNTNTCTGIRVMSHKCSYGHWCKPAEQSTCPIDDQYCLYGRHTVQKIHDYHNVAQ